MAFINGNPYTGFRGINLQGPNDSNGGGVGGYIRFGGTATAAMSNSGDIGIYPRYVGQKIVPMFWNGAVETTINPELMRVTDITSTSTLTVDQAGLIVTNATSSITLTFPSAAAVKGLTYVIVNRAANPVTLKSAAGDGLDSTTYANIAGFLTRGYIVGDGNMDASGDMWGFVADGSGTWYTVSRYIH